MLKPIKMNSLTTLPLRGKKSNKWRHYPLVNSAKAVAKNRSLGNKFFFGTVLVYEL